MSRKFLTVFIAIMAGILSILGGLLGNIATSTVPPGVLPLLRFSWPALGIVAFLSICIAVWQELRNDTTPVPVTHTTGALPSSVFIESIACPFCKKNDLQIQGKGQNSLILECKSCGKFLRIVHGDNKLLKMIIPGTTVLIGIIAIADYLHHDPAILADIVWDLFDGL